MDLTLRNPAVFPVGATVEAYPRSNWPAHVRHPEGAPLGAATDSAVVAADGTIDFTGLDPDTEYLAVYDAGGGEHRYVSFLTALTPTSLEGVAANGKGFVNHGATAGTARPSGFASIEWVGTVEPTNALDDDTWIDVS